MLKNEQEPIMSDLQKWPMEVSDALNEFKRLGEENESYNYRHSLVLQDLTQLKENVRVLRLKNRLLQKEKIELQESYAAAVPSSNPRPRTQKQMQKEMGRLTRELQLMTSQRNELRDHVIFITEGKVDDRPYHPPNPLNEKVKLQHRQALSALKRLEDENTKASEKLSELSKETVLYRGVHSWLLMQHTHLEQKVDLLRQEKKKLRDDWVLLMRHVEDLKVLCKNQEGNSDVKTQQQQELKGLVERLQFLLKQKEADTQKKDLAEKVQHHFEFSQMRSQTLQPEVEEATAQDESLLQKELLQEEPPAEPHPQQLLKSGHQFYSSNLDPIVE